jgi:hypothetical protein
MTIEPPRIRLSRRRIRNARGVDAHGLGAIAHLAEVGVLTFETEVVS